MSLPANLTLPEVGLELENCPARRGLAAAALAHEPEGLSGRDREADPVDRLEVADLSFEDHPPMNGKVLLQVFHFDEGRASALSHLCSVGEAVIPVFSPVIPAKAGIQGVLPVS